MRRLAIAMAFVYLGGVSVFLLSRGGWPTPDFLIPPLVIVAILTGRGWRFVIDWLPFLLLLLAYEGFRGLADDLNSRVHIVELIAAERWIAGGTIPSAWLQQHFFDPERLAWYDWGATFLHAAHFAVPVGFGLVLWFGSRALYWRYLVTVIGLSFAGFVTYYLYPAAPPWMASQIGLIPPVDRIIGYTLNDLSGGQTVSLAYHNFSPNHVAALPSLHAAMPLLISLIAISHWGKRALPALVYPAAGGIAWVYLGEHYVVDVIAGWAYAVAAFLALWCLAPSAVHLAGRLPALRLAHGTLSRVPTVPAWPLAATMVLLGAYVWVNPLIELPAPVEQPAFASVESLPFDLEPQPPAAELASMSDLGPVGCDAEESPLRTPDSFLRPLSGQYAGYIQGLDSGSCLLLTQARDLEPLPWDVLAYLRSEMPGFGLSKQTLSWPTAEGYAYLRVGSPSDALISEGAAPDQVYAIVVRTDSADNEGEVLGVMDQLARIALREDERP